MSVAHQQSVVDPQFDDVEKLVHDCGPHVWRAIGLCGGRGLTGTPCFCATCYRVVAIMFFFSHQSVKLSIYFVV
jgi:hypothetical protein